MSDEPSLPPSALLSPAPFLGPAQRRIAAFALTLFAVLGSVALLVGASIVIGRSISYFSSVLWLLATAGVIALILRPIVDYLQRRLLVREFVSIIEAFFRGQLLIGLIMGALLALGFTIIGLKFGLFIGLVLGVLNIVPYLGTITGLGVALPLAFFQPDGGWKLFGLVLPANLIVQSIESWILTPKIMGAQTGLHPAVVIIAIFFWGTAFSGILGMLLAIPLTAFFVTAWRLARIKYLSSATVP